MATTTPIFQFPARVTFTNPNGTLTPEASRALRDMFTRMGGFLGAFNFTSLALTGNAVIGGTLAVSHGTALLPSVYWGTDLSTGFYRIGLNNVGYSVAGAQVLNILSTGLTVTGVVTATSFSGFGTGLTGTAAGLTAGTVTTNANLVGPITSVGNTTSVASQTGTGSTFVMDTSPILVSPALGAATATSLVSSGPVNASTFTGAGTGLTGTAVALTSGTVTTNANLTGPIISIGNATAVASQTGTGSTFVMNTSPTLITPVLGDATASSIQGIIGNITPAAGTFTTVTTGGALTTPGGASFQTTSTALTNGAGAASGTLLNAPVAGNPTKWIGINDNGTIRYIPAW